MAPNEVDSHNELLVRQVLLTSQKNPKLTCAQWFQIGDSVRISGTKHNFPTKEYREKWTRELFKVFKIYKSI